ncbi:class B sortase [Candidatus Saccharibacteria bacterium]|nr:class B sortase [Candidatus Saccharibacteria bacterium]MCL1963421.1 class B sortase [Candidatus Saccharibacteria bacterium]
MGKIAFVQRNLARKILLLIIIAICTGILVFNAIIFVRWYIDGNNIAEEIKEIEEIAVMTEPENTEPELVNQPSNGDSDYWHYVGLPFGDVGLGQLKTINGDTVGFISVAGTNINYPVVRTGDNDYYLTHSFKKQNNQAGWVFMDFRNDTSMTNPNTIIYGHSRLDNTMFGSLKNILKTSWVNNKDNYVVRYVSESEIMLYQVFSVYKIPVESYYIQTSFGGDRDYQDWLDTMIGRSQYNFNTSVNTGDRILTLSTCYTDDTRVVLHAKLVKKALR